VTVAGELTVNLLACMTPLTSSIVVEGSNATRVILARLACQRIRLVHLKNLERGHILTNQSWFNSCVTAMVEFTLFFRRTATLEDRMHHLETLIQAIPPGVFAAGGAVPGVAAPHSSTDPSTNPLAAFASASHTYPTGVPPPSLHVFPLMNPSTHFTQDTKLGERAQSPNAAFRSLLGHQYSCGQSPMTADQLAEDTARMSLSASYMYFDDEGYTRWQGETSGLPLLDLLVERHSVPSARREIMARARRESMDRKPPDGAPPNSANKDWFPNRTPRRTDINPETLWRLITSYIVPDLMDRFVAIAP
jgi:hypothetical protein